MARQYYGEFSYHNEDKMDFGLIDSSMEDGDTILGKFLVNIHENHENMACQRIAFVLLFLGLLLFFGTLFVTVGLELW